MKAKYMKYLKLFPSLFLLFLTSCSSPASEIPPFNSSPQVINGHPIHYAEYPSVVAIMLSEGLSPLCTGTLIAPDLVLTAAHCLEYGDYISVVYGFDNPTLALRSDFKRVRDYKQFDNYFPNMLGQNWNDVGLILLADNLDEAVVSPILPPRKYRGNLSVGNNLTIIGYGDHVIHEDGGTLNGGEVPIISRDDYEMLIGKDDPNATNACFGDSGSGAFITDGDILYTTGITSRAPGEYFECGHGAIYTIPGTYLEWIADNYAKLKDNGIPRGDGLPLPISSTSSSSSTGGSVDIPADSKGCQYTNKPIKSISSFTFLLIIVFIGILYFIFRSEKK